MSQLPKNFEKMLLGGACVAAVGLAALGFMKSGAVETDFDHSLAGSGKDDVGIPEAAATTKAINSLKSNRVIEPGDDDGRPVDIFVGIPLFADKNNPNKPVDLIDGKEVHEGIPNRWWIETGADITFANSPDRDDDGDGYTNREEYEGKTHPVDAKSYPPLINKLAYLKDESIQWYVQFGFESGGKWAPNILGVMPDGKAFKSRVSAVEMLEVGDTFFEDGPFAGRFKFTGMTEKEVTSERTQLTQTKRIGLYEDLKPNKAGTKYESEQSLPKAQLDASAYYDRTAVLELQAIGEEGTQFKVEEGTKFALPSGGDEKNYLLKTVTPESIVVEYTDADGKTQTKEISKGGTP
ncbi:Amuc_1099 family pilus-like system protein [Luteolibacter marinus]|uniref:Amuc_1099 family pilus-like system protein n=1 Tax=Luteolibacter marinus TaxID=2776705 RepID=UPI0018689E76|nr:Amuc_1099 family pilus-like system protein [Luteolibacter marinus]